MKKVIVRIKGGLGNQLFCYAAARRLALVNDAELVIDDITGFARDKLFRRIYCLDKFNIKARKATPCERMEPFERARRGIAKHLAKKRNFFRRKYIEQEGVDFDARLLDFKVRGTVYLDGYWQNEKYFKDVRKIIREDFKMAPSVDTLSSSVLNDIRDTQSVAVHLRWFDAPGIASNQNVLQNYYEQAIALTKIKINNPKYFLFSDNIQAALEKVSLTKDKIVCVSRGCDAESVLADLFLMSQCKHFVIANSTFSWWGAWLSGFSDKTIIAPQKKFEGDNNIIPKAWIIV